MKQTFTIILIISFINIATGQNYKRDTVIYHTICQCDSILRVDTSKCLDELGRKQGYWAYYRDKIHINKTDGDIHDIHKITEPIMKGNYKDGMKTGKWDYFHKSDINYFGELFIYSEYSITYFSDGSKEIENYLKNYRIKYNKDSTEISGLVIRLINKTKSILIDTLPNPYAFEIYINSRIVDNEVKLRMSFKDEVIKEFDKQYLDDELFALEIGMYDRLITNYAR